MCGFENKCLFSRVNSVILILFLKILKHTRRSRLNIPNLPLVEGKQLSQDSYGCFADDRRYPMMGDVQRTFASELIGEDCSEVCRLRGYAFSGGAK